MYTISLSIQKGGVGKTALSVTFAAELAKHGKTVVIDADPQGTATSHFNPDELEYDLADYFFGQCTADKLILNTNVENLDLVPTAGVGGQLKMYSETKGVSDYMCFKRLVRDLEAQGYEYCVIDLSPAFGTFERMHWKLLTKQLPRLSLTLTELTDFRSLSAAFRKQNRTICLKNLPIRKSL